MTKEEQIAERIGALVGTYGTDEEIEFFKKFLDAYKKTVDLYTNLKQVEKEHQEENGKLRVELEKYKLLNANIEKANKIIKSNKLNEKEREIIETYRKLIEETGRNDWIICNPKTMWSNYFVRKDKIQEKIEEYEGLKILDKQAYEEQIKPLKELLEDNNG